MAFLILYWTGIRIGELLALTYEDIDLEKRIIRITKSYRRIKGKDMVTPPKTPKTNRKVTIPLFLAEELKAYCSMLYGISPKERMFRFTKSFMEHEIVRGIKEVVYQLVKELQMMQMDIRDGVSQFEQQEITKIQDSIYEQNSNKKRACNSD